VLINRVLGNEAESAGRLNCAAVPFCSFARAFMSVPLSVQCLERFGVDCGDTTLNCAAVPSPKETIDYHRTT
jgi:hypothetical protein